MATLGFPLFSQQPQIQQSPSNSGLISGITAPVGSPDLPTPTITYPIFPTLTFGQFYTKPGDPVRGPGWSVKRSATWSNQRNVLPSGRQYVVKYWPNPLWKWEFTYEVILDDPSNNNPFYGTPPMPATDFETLQSFFVSMQGQGVEFAYQPPDAVRGGSFTMLAFQTQSADVPKVWFDPSVPVTQLKLGDILWFSGTNPLQNGYGTVIAIDAVQNAATFVEHGLGSWGYETIVGNAVGGQPLFSKDFNGNIEIVNSVGSFPIPATSPTPEFNAFTAEAVQLLDTTTLNIYGAGTNLNSLYTLAPADTIQKADFTAQAAINPYYEGVVAQFGSNSIANGPITASFTYYYICRFSEDTQEYENFMTTLWNATVKIEQVRI